MTSENNTTTYCSPFASLPWEKLAAAKMSAVITQQSKIDSKRDFARNDFEFDQPQSNELYAMLTGGCTSGMELSTDFSPALPLLSPISPLLSRLLVSSPSLPLTVNQTCNSVDLSLDDNGTLSPSLERLICQLQNDSTATTSLLECTTTMPPINSRVGKAAQHDRMAAGKSKRKKKNKHDPRGPTQHVLDTKLRSMFDTKQLHMPSDHFKALLARMQLTDEEIKRVKQLRRRVKCVEYSRANRLKNRLKRDDAAVATHVAKASGGAGNTGATQRDTLIDENRRLNETLGELKHNIDRIEREKYTALL